MTNDGNNDLSMLVLQEKHLIGRGNGRICFRHPINHKLCLKLPLNERGERESVRESVYLDRASKRYGDSVYKHVARLYEPVVTDRGKAWAAERVLDELTDRPSPLLRDVLTEASFEQDAQAWNAAFEEFMDWTAKSAIVFRDWSSTNVCVKKMADGRNRFIIIDGFAPKEILLRWFPNRTYGRHRNNHFAKRANVESISALIELCARERSDIQS